MKQAEKTIHKQICEYLRVQYPNVIFTSEASGIKLNMGQARYAKATRNPARGLPDIWILYPTDLFNGLFLEVKTDISAVYTKQMDLRKIEHIKEQAKVINRLSNLGYYATFVFGFDHAKNLIDRYMNNHNPVNYDPPGYVGGYRADGLKYKSEL